MTCSDSIRWLTIVPVLALSAAVGFSVSLRAKEAVDVSRLAGKPVRLRLVITDADLYAFRFVEE